MVLKFSSVMDSAYDCIKAYIIALANYNGYDYYLIFSKGLYFNFIDDSNKKVSKTLLAHFPSQSLEFDYHGIYFNDYTFFSKQEFSYQKMLKEISRKFEVCFDNEIDSLNPIIEKWKKIRLILSRCMIKGSIQEERKAMKDLLRKVLQEEYDFITNLKEKIKIISADGKNNE